MPSSSRRVVESTRRSASVAPPVGGRGVCSAVPARRRDSVGGSCRPPTTRTRRRIRPGGHRTEPRCRTTTFLGRKVREKAGHARTPHRVSRRGLLIGGLAVVGLGGGALVVRQLRRGGPPVGAWIPLRAIPAPTAPVALSPAVEPPGIDTSVTMWAHADDDIIFANPELSDAIAGGATVARGVRHGGRCREGARLRREREAGSAPPTTSCAAPPRSGTNAGSPSSAVPTVTRFVPSDEPRLSITVLRLPDGGLNGKGFPSNGERRAHAARQRRCHGTRADRRLARLRTCPD